MRISFPVSSVSLPPSAFSRLLLALSALFLLPVTALGEQPEVVYLWDANNWLTKYNHTQFSAEPITNPDGTAGAMVRVTPRDEQNPYNHIVVTAASMQTGHEYTAVLTCKVASPTVYPTSFYMFARNSAGNQYDIWQTWIGLPGETRTMVLPMDLKTVGSGTWKLFMGISKAGGLEINSLVVYRGLTSNGKTTYQTASPTPDATPGNTLPDGLTEATGFTPFTVTPPEKAGNIITLAPPAYNFVADSATATDAVAVENAIAFQQAVKDCRGKGATKLIIPSGIYRLSSPVSLTLDGLEDVTIAGQGSTLIVEKMAKDGAAFIVNHFARLTIENLTMDWDWKVQPIASLGIVSNLSADKAQADFTFPDLDAARIKVTLATQWRSIFAMDLKRLIRTDPNIYNVPKTVVITPGSADNVLHAIFPEPAPLVEGSTYCIRHLYYDMCGFKISEGHDLTFKFVTINSIPGMGWFFAGPVQNILLTHCNIMRPGGSRYPLTTAADGLHVDQSLGNLIFEDCYITGTGDDAMNVHNEVYQAEIAFDETDPTKLTLLNCPSYQLRVKAGDSIEFFNADFSNLNNNALPVSREVATVSSDNHGKPRTFIQFTAPLPQGLTAQSIVRNARFATKNVRIAHCNIEYSNGRGLLLSAENALVTGCRMSHVYSTAIDLEAEIVQPLWTEGRGASNVVIEGNTFDDNNQQVRYGGAILYTNPRIPWGQTTATLFDRILIENNRFLNCPGPAVSFMNCTNLIVRSNEIRLTEAVANTTRYAGAICLTKSSNLALGGNRWINEVPAKFTGGVVYDPATTSNVSLDTNAVTTRR